jgi:hypothetical protein
MPTITTIYIELLIYFYLCVILVLLYFADHYLENI